MRKFFSGILVLIVSVASAFGQTPTLQMNVVYVCTDGQSFKVFSCSDATGACDYQNYKKGQAFQRGEALRVQLTALLPAKCHAQTAAEAQADPHRGEIPPAPSPFKARAVRAATAAGAATANQQRARGRRIQGWRHGARSGRRLAGRHGHRGARPVVRRYVCRVGLTLQNCGRTKVHRLGKLTAEDHAAGQYDIHDRVQVLVNGKWMEGEIRGQNNVNMYDIKVPGVDTGFGSDIVNTTADNIRMSNKPAPPAPAQRAAGQAPKPGLVSCAGKYEGRWEHVSGMGGMKVVFRSGKATITEGLGGEMPFDCFTGDGKVVFYPAGSFTPFSYDFDINDDGTLQTPLGAIKKMGK